MKNNDHTIVDRQKVGRRTARWIDHGCSMRELCVRCSMMKIASYRFKVFRETFGRDPLPHEPLFFSAKAKLPRIIGRDQVIKQLEQAAHATKVTLPPVLQFLGLSTASPGLITLQEGAELMSRSARPDRQGGSQK